jgi:hypothetical protein
MTSTNLEFLRSALETKYRELSGSSRDWDQIAVERAPDALDQVQLMGEPDLAILNLNRNSVVLREIRRSRRLRMEPTVCVCAATPRSRPSVFVRFRGGVGYRVPGTR